MNLHDIVRGAITLVHDDEEAYLYRSAGQVNVKGKIHARYEEAELIRGNFQPLDAKALQQLERMEITGNSVEAFLYSYNPKPVSGVSRIPFTRTGDFVLRNDDTWWLVTSVLEDWSADGWVSVALTQQLTPPEV